MVEDGFRIRSYRVCFELERRIHRIERWRIPVPYGVPLRGIVYGTLLLALVLVLRRLPGFGELLGVLHPALRLVVLPVGGAWALVRLRVDGRPVHAAGLSWIAWRLGPGRVVGFRAAEGLGPALIGDICVAPDERSARYRRARITGPAVVVLRYPVQARRSRGRLELRQTGKAPLWSGRRVAVAKGQEVGVG